MTIVVKLPVNASAEAATAVLERYAQLAGEQASIEANRADAIASTNAVADQLLTPVLAEMAAIAVKVEPWWARNGAALLPKNRKTMELGGCMIGLKVGSVSLSLPGDADTSVALLMAQGGWAKPYVRVSFAVDKAATKKAMAHKTHGPKLKALGFSLPAATDVFVLQRAEQAGLAGS